MRLGNWSVSVSVPSLSLSELRSGFSVVSAFR